MKNTRTLISSSIVSFIIMILGLFMLCMSRAPKITFDEPLIEGGGVEYDSVGVQDQDFLSLLNEANDEKTLMEDTEQSTSSDDDFLSLLNENDLNSNSNDQSFESGDEGMEEILRLLELDDDTGSEKLNKTEETDWLQELEAIESNGTSSQPGETSSSEKESIDQLSKEVEKLEEVLSNKTTQVESLQVAINQYDQRIGDTQQQSFSGRDRTSIRTVSHYEATSTEPSSYDNYSGSSDNYISGDFEESYNTALEMFQNHQYQQAIDGFFRLLLQNLRHPLADNCQYWIGECRYAQGKYYQAVVEFNKVFVYDAPDKQDDAQLMLGLTFMKMGELNSARSELDWLVSCYSSSEYVNTAHRYLGQF